MNQYTIEQFNAAITLSTLPRDERIALVDSVASGREATVAELLKDAPAPRVRKRRAVKSSSAAAPKPTAKAKATRAPRTPRPPTEAKGKRNRATVAQVKAAEDAALETVTQAKKEVGLAYVMTQIKDIPQALVSRSLSKLADAGKLKSKGERRARVYWAA